MKIIYTVLLIIISLVSNTFSQEGSITRIIDENTVEINLGIGNGINVGDQFEVFGTKQAIHPATGAIVNKEDVSIGIITITEVFESHAIAKVENLDGKLNSVKRVVKTSLDNNTNEDLQKPIEKFVNPNNTDYSQTIYEKKDVINDSLKTVITKRGVLKQKYFGTSFGYSLSNFGSEEEFSSGYLVSLDYKWIRSNFLQNVISLKYSYYGNAANHGDSLFTIVDGEVKSYQLEYLVGLYHNFNPLIVGINIGVNIENRIFNGNDRGYQSSLLAVNFPYAINLALPVYKNMYLGTFFSGSFKQYKSMGFALKYRFQ